MNLEYYVLSYDFNQHKVERFNIFNNCHVNEWTVAAVKKYIRSPKKYKYIKQYKNEYLNQEEIVLYGFDALCAEIRSILMNQLWSRREYEISVSDAFVYEIRDIVDKLDQYNDEELRQKLKDKEKRNPRLEKYDAFYQCELNIPVIARECIYQVKEERKKQRA